MISKLFFKNRIFGMREKERFKKNSFIIESIWDVISWISRKCLANMLDKLNNFKVCS